MPLTGTDSGGIAIPWLPKYGAVEPAPPRPEDIAASGDVLAEGDTIVVFIERRDQRDDPET